MCTGVEIALLSAAASAGGSYINTQKQNKNAQTKINARNEQAAAEQTRQRGYQDANDMAVQGSLGEFNKDKREESFGDLVAAREQAYESNTPAASEFANISDSTPMVVKTDLAKRVADGMAKSKSQAKALAKIGGTSDLFQSNGFAINDAANSIGTTNSLARGSLQTNLIEQQAAANSVGNGRSSFGDLLSAGGAAGSIYAGAGGTSSLGAGKVNPATAQMGPFTDALPWRNTPTVPSYFG